MSRQIEVTPAQVAAARLQLVVDAKLGHHSLEVIRKIAEAQPLDVEHDAALDQPA